MADIGTQEGIWTGVGQGMASLGQAIAKRREGQVAARDKQAEAFEKQMQDIAANIATVGADTPEARPLKDELNRVVTMHNSLYGVHETPLLVQRVQNFTSKLPGVGKIVHPYRGQPQVDIRAQITPEQMIAAAPSATQKTDWQIDAGIPLRAANGIVYRAERNSRTGATRWVPLPGMRPQDIDPASIQEARAAGLTEEQIREQALIKGGIEARAGTSPYKVYVSPDKKERQYFRVGEEPEGWTVAPTGAAARPKTAWTKINGRFVNVQLDDQNHPIPGTEFYGEPPTSIAGRVTESTYHMLDAAGNVLAIPTVTTSRPLDQGGAARPNISQTTPGTPQTQTQTGRPGTTTASGQPRILAFKGTPPQQKAIAEFGQAVKAAEEADLAAKTRGSAEDKLLIEALTKDVSGRFNITSYNNIVEGSGLANRLQQWYNNVLGGGQLPDDVRNQAIQAAHHLVDASKAELRALRVPAEYYESKDDAVKRIMGKLKLTQ